MHFVRLAQELIIEPKSEFKEWRMKTKRKVCKRKACNKQEKEERKKKTLDILLEWANQMREWTNHETVSKTEFLYRKSCIRDT